MIETPSNAPSAAAFPGSDDPDNLRTVYQALAASRNDYRTRIWETFKAAAAVEAAVLAGLAGLLAKGLIPINFHPAIGVSLIFFALFIYAFVFFNARREQELLYQDEFSMFQIEKLWGLHAEIPAALRWLPDARFMFVQKHLNPRYRCSPVSETEGDPENDEEKDAPTMWAKRRVAGQPFSQYIVSGYSLILALPLLAVGVVLLLS